MLWQLFNFKIILDEKFKPACEAIRTDSTSCNKIIDSRNLIKLKILPSEVKDLSQLQDYSSKLIRYGELYFNLENLNLFFFYDNNNFNILNCLNILLINIIKLSGLKYKTFLLHSASVVKKEHALIIPGKQGRGKTTLSKNLKEYSILNDDLSLIVKEDENWVTYKIPDPLHLLNTDPFLWQGPFLIKKIIFIRNKTETGLKKLSPDNALRAFFQESPSLFIANNTSSQRDIYQTLIKDFIFNTDNFLISYNPDTDYKLLRELQKN